MLLLEEVVADEERSQVAREVLVAGDGVSGDARESQSEEALPEDREVVVEEILERPVVGRRLVVRRWEPARSPAASCRWRRQSALGTVGIYIV